MWVATELSVLPVHPGNWPIERNSPGGGISPRRLLQPGCVHSLPGDGCANQGVGHLQGKAQVNQEGSLGTQAVIVLRRDRGAQLRTICTLPPATARSRTAENSS